MSNLVPLVCIATVGDVNNLILAPSQLQSKQCSLLQPSALQNIPLPPGYKRNIDFSTYPL